MISRLVPLLLLATTAGAAQPAGERLPPDPTNAALLYYKYFIVMDGELPGVARDAFDDAGEVTPEAARALAEHQDVIQGFLRASRLPECDFGVEYSQSYGALLTHLGKIRGAGQLLCADARRLADEGDSAAAADRIVATINSARHLRHDRTLISSLTGVAMVGLALEAANDAAPALDPDDAGRVIEAIESVDRASPINLRQSGAAEVWFFEPLSERVLATPAPGKELVRITINEFGFDPDEVAPLAQYGPGEIEAVFNEARAASAALDAAWDAPDPVAEAKRVSAEIADGDYGPYARITSPSMYRMMEVRQQLLTQIDETIATLRPIAEGAD